MKMKTIFFYFSISFEMHKLFVNKNKKKYCLQYFVFLRWIYYYKNMHIERYFCEILKIVFDWNIRYFQKKSGIIENDFEHFNAIKVS